MSKFSLIRYKHFSIQMVFITLLTACGADSDSDKNKAFNGYMPKFSADSVQVAPKASTINAASISSQQTVGKHLAAPEVTQASHSVANLESSNELSDDSADSIEFESIDCSKATELWNASPQASDFENSALDFSRNLQAQTVFYDCITREQVFNRSAEIVNVDSTSTVTAEFAESNNSYFVSWSMPTAVLNASQNKELQVDSQGILVNLQPGIDNTKTRVDLSQVLVNDEFVKRIRSTLQDRLGNTTNIRSVTINERRSNTNELLQQNITGRIVFDNKLSVLAAAIKPNVGAVMYLKQCEFGEAGNTNDYLRECGSGWNEVVYNSQWELTTDVNTKTDIKSNLKIATESVEAGALSIDAEQKFYNDEDESSFFNKRALPQALIVN